MCWSSPKRAEQSLKAAQKGFQYAKSIGSTAWCINNAFLVARAYFLQGDVEEAREALTGSVSRAVTMKRKSCTAFLEKVGRPVTVRVSVFIIVSSRPCQ